MNPTNACARIEQGVGSCCIQGLSLDVVVSPKQTDNRTTGRQTDRPTESRQTDRGRQRTSVVPVRIGRQRPTEADRGARQLSTDRAPTEPRQSPDRAPTEPDRARQTDSQGSKHDALSFPFRPGHRAHRRGGQTQRCNVSKVTPTAHAMAQNGPRTRIKYRIARAERGEVIYHNRGVSGLLLTT